MAGERHGTNKTSFLESQRSWSNEDRKYYPRVRARHLLKDRLTMLIFEYQITFHWQRDKAQHGPLREGPVHNLLFHGLLVVDYDCKPIKAYPDLPLTLASRFEGSKIEAIMRLDCRIGLSDFLARMPYKASRGSRAAIFPHMALYKPGNLSNRARDFRNLIGSISWNARRDKATQRIIRFMDARRPAAQKARNTVRGLRNLNEVETLYLEALSFSTRPERARKNRLRATDRRKAHIDRFRAKCHELKQPEDLVNDDGILDRDLLNEKIAGMYPAWRPTPHASPSHETSDDDEGNTDTDNGHAKIDEHSPDTNAQSSTQEDQIADDTMRDVQQSSSGGWQSQSARPGFNNEADDLAHPLLGPFGASIPALAMSPPHPLDLDFDAFVADEYHENALAGPSQPLVNSSRSSPRASRAGLINGIEPEYSRATAEDIARVRQATVLVDDAGNLLDGGDGHVLVRLDGKNFYVSQELLM